MRIELFGDEVESIRKFDPATQRSAGATDDVVLLPLTETPVDEETLAAINARLSGERVAGDEELIEQTLRATGVTVFPGWELYAPIAGARHTFFDLLPRATVVLDEPDATTRGAAIPGGQGWPRHMSAAWSATWSVPKTSTSRPSSGRNSLEYVATVAVEQLGIEDNRKRRAPDLADAADHALPRLGRRHGGRSRAA